MPDAGSQGNNAYDLTSTAPHLNANPIIRLDDLAVRALVPPAKMTFTEAVLYERNFNNQLGDPYSWAATTSNLTFATLGDAAFSATSTGYDVLAQARIGGQTAKSAEEFDANVAKLKVELTRIENQRGQSVGAKAWETDWKSLTNRELLEKIKAGILSPGSEDIRIFAEQWQYNFKLIQGPLGTSFTNATLSQENVKQGYTLDKNPNGVLWRVNAAGKPHPLDLEAYYAQNRIIERTTWQTIEEKQESGFFVAEMMKNRDPSSIRYGTGSGNQDNVEAVTQLILAKESLNSSYNDPYSPPNFSLQDTFKKSQISTEYFSYMDKDRNTVTRRWTISNKEFLDCNALTQEQVTNIIKSKNPELINRGFDKVIYEYSQQLRINPKVLLSSLAQEQNWCRQGGYDEAFGVGPGGKPGSFADGGIAIAARTYLNAFTEGRSYGDNIPAIKVNQDANADERKAVFGSATAVWEAANPQYVQYMNEGITIKPVNAAMYAKLLYTPWIDFPPQESHPLMDWHDIFRSF